MPLFLTETTEGHHLRLLQAFRGTAHAPTVRNAEPGKTHKVPLIVAAPRRSLSLFAATYSLCPSG
jgi:hypothetical protein